MSSLVTDDLATQTVPSTEAQILNQENIAVGRPWSYTCHTVNLGGMGLSWYTTDTTASGTEFGEAVGSAFLGIPQTVADGDISIQIYVEYDIEFCQRITASLVPAPYNLIGGRFYQTNFTPAAGNLLVGGTADNSNQNLVLDPVAGTITLTQPGTYLISALITGTTLVGPAALTGAGLIASVTNTGSTSILATWIVTGASGGTILGPLSIASYALLTNIQVRIGYAPDASLSMSEEDTYPKLRVMDDKLSWRKSFPSTYSLTKH